MAIKLSTLFKGITAEYWKITGSLENFQTGKTQVILSLYLNQASRIENLSNNLLNKSVTLPGVELTRAEQYLAIKQLPEFQNAEDC